MKRTLPDTAAELDRIDRIFRINRIRQKQRQPLFGGIQLILKILKILSNSSR